MSGNEGRWAERDGCAPGEEWEQAEKDDDRDMSTHARLPFSSVLLRARGRLRPRAVLHPLYAPMNPTSNPNPMTMTQPNHLEHPHPPVETCPGPATPDTPCTPITTLSSWSAPPRPSSRWRGVLITIGIVLAWLLLFIVLASPIFIDLWMGCSSATCDSHSSLSSSSQSPSEIK